MKTKCLRTATQCILAPLILFVTRGAPASAQVVTNSSLPASITNLANEDILIQF